MRIFVMMFIGMFFCANGIAQQATYTDSLYNRIQHSADEADKLRAILRLAEVHVYRNPDSCLNYTTMGLELLKDPVAKNKIDERTLNMAEARLYGLSATALSEQRNDSLAIKYALKTVQLIENIHTGPVTRLLENVAEAYQNIKEPDIAIDYFRKAVQLEREPHIKQIWIANLGSCFYDLQQYDSATFYLNKVDLDFETGRNQPWPMPHYYKGLISLNKGENEKALDHFRTAIRFGRQSRLPLDLCQSYIGIAKTFHSLGKMDSAIWYATTALKNAQESAFPNQSLDATNLLADLYGSQHLYDSAYLFQKEANTLKDSIYSKEKIKQLQNFAFNEKLRQQEVNEEKTAFKNRLWLFALGLGVIILLLFIFFLNRNNQQKRKANKELKNTVETLKATQSQLIQSEKMASLGELTAGIAHEIQNPLNFVNNFSDVNIELIDEMDTEANKGNIDEVKLIAKDIKDNELKINQHGKRADAIVKGMLQHSRESKGQKEQTDINALADEYFRIAYHGLKSKDDSFSPVTRTDFDKSIGNINIIPQDIGRVLLNLFNNAFYYANEKSKQNIPGYEPAISINTKKIGNKIELKIKDNGNGIPQKVIGKIFQPFFTTKPSGQGTGLGLSLSYDIIKAHGGEIRVNSSEGQYSEFIIQLPNA